jgi:hypothetical protein
VALYKIISFVSLFKINFLSIQAELTAQIAGIAVVAAAVAGLLFGWLWPESGLSG